MNKTLQDLTLKNSFIYIIEFQYRGKECFLYDIIGFLYDMTLLIIYNEKKIYFNI